MSNDLVNTLVVLSEKAANIARICRQDNHLLSLLVQEKIGEEKNPRFVQDFKTFADVLVQEVVKYHVENSFAYLKGNILGEETNTFKKDDECIKVEVKENVMETEKLLFKALQDEMAAHVLSQEVHNEVSTNHLINCHHKLPDDIAVWIDPIDSTAEYINGKETSNGDGICGSGLQCVTVLIGVFHKTTGQPIFGVINQPFYSFKNDKWEGRCFYGISLEEQTYFHPQCSIQIEPKVIVVSSSEKEEVKQCLQDGGYTVIEAAGAGYKGLAVITGLASAYILSKGSTYPWDICAVNAILNAMGGGIVDFTSRLPLTYSMQPKPNSSGLLAYKHPSTLEHITTLLDAMS